MPLAPDWDRLLADCPGAEDGFPPPAVGFGAIDVRREDGFEAVSYLLDLGVKHLTPDVSPLTDCFRLRFKYGRSTGLRQSFAPRRRPQPKPTGDEREPAGGRSTTDRPHRSLAFRLGRLVGRWSR